MIMKIRFLVFRFLVTTIILCQMGCIANKSISFEKKLSDQIENNPTFNRYFLGFKLYDLSSSSTIYEYNSDKYFAPASNTKIFTLFACLNYLNDSIPAIKYTIRNDSLIVWGTGDPTFLHPDFAQHAKVFDFLKNHFGPLVFSNQHFYNERFGPGWAWDDYPYYFSTEITPFPIYGNAVRFSETSPGRISITPRLFSDSSQTYFPYEKIKSSIWREEYGNTYKYNPNTTWKEPRDAPIYFTDASFIKLLEDTLSRPVEIGAIPMDSMHNTFYSIDADTVYRRMMQISDNFLAEQLLLLCAANTLDSLSSEAIIRHANENLLSDLPDPPIWKDGSGLSRYNLFTPRSIVKLLEKTYLLIDEERLFSIFPSGGKNGTIENWYKNDAPYIYAKTGTFSNNHSLSGYLITAKGKRLIFSFMHNNYPHGSSKTKVAMTPILEYIRDQY